MRRSNKFKHIFLTDGYLAFAAARRESKLKNYEIAEVADIPTGTVGRIFVSGYTRVNWMTIIKLAKVMGINPTLYIKPKYCGFNLPKTVMDYQDGLTKRDKLTHERNIEIWGDLLGYLKGGHPSFMLMLTHTKSGVFISGKRVTITTSNQLMVDFVKCGDVEYSLAKSCQQYYDNEDIVVDFQYTPKEKDATIQTIMDEIEGWIPSADEIIVKHALGEERWKSQRAWTKNG